MSFQTKPGYPLTREVIVGVVTKYQPRLKRHVRTATFLTQVDDMDLDVLLRLAETVIRAADKKEQEESDKSLTPMHDARTIVSRDRVVVG